MAESGEPGTTSGPGLMESPSTRRSPQGATDEVLVLDADGVLVLGTNVALVMGANRVLELGTDRVRVLEAVVVQATIDAGRDAVSALYAASPKGLLTLISSSSNGSCCCWAGLSPGMPLDTSCCFVRRARAWSLRKAGIFALAFWPPCEVVHVALGSADRSGTAVTASWIGAKGFSDDSSSNDCSSTTGRPPLGGSIALYRARTARTAWGTSWWEGSGCCQ